VAVGRGAERTSAGEAPVGGEGVLAGGARLKDIDVCEFTVLASQRFREYDIDGLQMGVDIKRRCNTYN
jgi:hypothetical protein